MIQVSRKAMHRGRTPSRFTSWLWLATLGILSTAAIGFTALNGGGASAQEGKKGKSAKAAVVLKAIPGAGQKLDAAALARIIDNEIARRLKEETIAASPKADDSEFLRRVYLDLTGVVPTADKVIAFLESKDPQKRAKVIEELLSSPRFGTWMAENWVNAMVPRESNNRLLKSAPLQEWLADSFNKNTPWDKLVYELLTSTGEQDKNGAVTYFIANPTVDKITDSVTSLFMGQQLQCAQCHNHPFTDYKQKEYWAMAQFFIKVRATNPQKAAKAGTSPGVEEAFAAKAGKKGLPESAMMVPAKLLRDAEPKMAKSEPYRPYLAKWLTTRENPYFAKAFVNRMWAHFYGRGFVNAVDDMHDGNPATHPELMASLSEQFKTSGFDVKYLARAIVSSEAYQRTSRPHNGNGDDSEMFSRMYVRVMAPEQLYDSLVAVLGQNARFDTPKGKGAAVGKKGPGTPRQQFVNFFRIDEGNDPLQYQHGIPQALRLMNSPQLNNTNGLVATAMKAGTEPTRVVEHLYLAALSRRPTAAELERRVEYVRRASDARTAYGDIAWALVNCSEFVLNH